MFATRVQGEPVTGKLGRYNPDRRLSREIRRKRGVGENGHRIETIEASDPPKWKIAYHRHLAYRLPPSDDEPTNVGNVGWVTLGFYLIGLTEQ